MPLLTRYLRRRRYDMIQPHLRGTVLDLGCGNAATNLALHAVERYVGLDYNLRLLTHMRRHCPQLEFVHCDVDRDPFPIGGVTFDTVLMAAVLEHLSEPGRVLGQAAAHLRPGGRLVLTTPTPWGERIHRMGARVGLFHPLAAQEHKAAYDRQGLKVLLSTHDFVPVLYQTFELGANQLVVCRHRLSTEKGELLPCFGPGS